MIYIALCVAVAMGLLISIAATVVLVYIHECGHRRAIRKLSLKTPEFTETLYTEIMIDKWMGAREGYTDSNYLMFLSSDPCLYRSNIQVIGRAGVRSSFIFCAIAASISILIVIAATNGFLFYASVAISVSWSYWLVWDSVEYFASNKVDGDKSHVRNPEKYEYKKDPNFEPKIRIKKIYD